MTLAKNVQAALPQLRRFGTMMTGSRKQADALMFRCLNELGDDRTKLGSDEDTKTGLFRLFVAIADQHEVSTDDQQPHGRDVLAAMTKTERQAFLLRYVEEFNLHDTAKIMGISPSDINALEKQFTLKLSQTSIEAL